MEILGVRFHLLLRATLGQQLEKSLHHPGHIQIFPVKRFLQMEQRGKCLLLKRIEFHQI